MEYLNEKELKNIESALKEIKSLQLKINNLESEINFIKNKILPSISDDNAEKLFRKYGLFISFRDMYKLYNKRRGGNDEEH